MRELPEFAILTNSEIPGIKVISTTFPYIIASVHDYHRDDERVQDRMDDMAQGRYPIAKVKGYTVFLTMYTSLEPCDDKELQQQELKDMADFFLKEKIGHKPGQYAKCEESGNMQRKIEKFTERRLRERKKRTNETNN